MVEVRFTMASMFDGTFATSNARAVVPMR
jgi:hypothetical protein